MKAYFIYFVPGPNSSIVRVAKINKSIKALKEALRNLASVAFNELYHAQRTPSVHQFPFTPIG